MAALTSADLEQYASGLPSNILTRVDIREARESLSRPPSFMLGTVPVSVGITLFGELMTGPVRLYSLKDACMTLDGIVLHDGHALSSVMLNHPDYHVAATIRDGLGDAMSLPVRRIEKRAVMLSGPGYTVYGHWLVDLLPRLWVLKEAGLDPSELHYVVPEQSPKFLLPLLALFDIGAHQLITYNERTEIIQVAELLLPSNLRRGSRLDPSMSHARDYMLERMREAGPWPVLKDRPDRIFISRRNADPSRSLSNRERVEALARKQGYVLVAPEDLTLPEQVSLFGNARQVVGEYGSGLHNTIFSPPGTAVCALRGTSRHPGFIQSGLSDICGQHTGYVFGDTPLDAVHQAFEIPEHLFSLAMRCTALSVTR